MIRDILDKDRRNLLRLDLANDFGDVLCRSLALRAHSFRGDELQAIGRTKIAKRIVRGDDAPVIRCDLSNAGLYFRLELIHIRNELTSIGFVSRLSLWIDRNQPVTNVPGINLAVGQALPGVNRGGVT